MPCLPFFRRLSTFCFAGLLLVSGPLRAGDVAALEKEVRELSNGGKLAEARVVAEALLALREQADGAESLPTATALNSLGEICTDLGDYPRGETLFLRALALRERLLGEQHKDTALSVSNLADLYFKRGLYSQADPLNRRALAIRVALSGPDSLDAARSWNNLGAQLLQSGDLAGAEDAFTRVVKACTAAGDAPGAAFLHGVGLGNLALIREHLGDEAGARALGARVLEFRERTQGAEHPTTVQAAHNLAVSDYQLGNVSAAEAGWRRVLAARRKALGDEHPDTLRALFYLALLESEHRDFAHGIEEMQEAVAASQRALGPESVAVARDRGVLAELLWRASRLDDAQREARASAAVQARVLAPAHIDRRHTLRVLGGILSDAGERDEAQKVAREWQTAEEAFAHDVFRFAPEEQRLEFRRSSEPYALAAALGDAGLLARAVLRNKALVIESLLEDRRVARAAQAGGRVPALNRLTFLRRQWARANAQPIPVDPDKVAARERFLAEATGEMEGIERELSRGGPGIRAALAAEPAALPAALPTGAVLVEFIRWEPSVGPAKRTLGAQYGAVVVDATGGPAWIPLGRAAAIEGELARFARALAGRDTAADLTLEESLGELRRLVWEPVEGRLPANAREVIISPDAALNFAPFAAFPSGKGPGFLAQRYDLRFVATGRDLLSVPPKPASAARSLVVFADPASATPGRALPAAGSEGRAVAALAETAGWNARVFAGADARKDGFLALQPAPRALHLAAHGFFLPPDAALGARANAMRRSGFLLAGASGPADEGAVTAEDIAGLDLRGTWLATLAACESGLGEARAGEGVLGLRRGFAFAGVRHLLLTLWPVEDSATAAFMRDFYARALASDGDDAAGPFRAAQREALARETRTRGRAAAVRAAGAVVLTSQRGE